EQFVCLVAGDGEDRRWLERFVRKHRLEATLRLLGAVSSRRVRELLCAADLLLLPSAQEGLAIALYEALAMQVVPIAADVGGQRELVTPECGVLIPPAPNETAQYIDALAQLLRDPAQRMAMAQAGRARILAHFTQQAMLGRMQALFAEADQLAQTTPRPPVAPGQGHAAAALAIEHYQLETRLRGFTPVRLALRLRQSPIKRSAGALATLRMLLERWDRGVYALRRTLMQQVRRK
ncbi:MAG: glycosyltransferase, partial [Roseiflexaceae bacterium]|nr:glycosyltransferase [Roseiflexaceae bacterium]